MDTFCLLLPLNPETPYFIGRNIRGCAQPRNSFISQEFNFADQAIFDFSLNKVSFISILPLRVLHVRLLYFRVCKIQNSFFFGFFAILNIYCLEIFAAPMGVRDSWCQLSILVMN